MRSRFALLLVAATGCEPAASPEPDRPPEPRCGDGVVQAGEACDPPDGVTCDAACAQIEAPPGCGDDLGEPDNDLPESAPALLPGFTASAVLCAEDEDWYHFTTAVAES